MSAWKRERLLDWHQETFAAGVFVLSVEDDDRIDYTWDITLEEPDGPIVSQGHSTTLAESKSAAIAALRKVLAEAATALDDAEEEP